jgi:hypothetical protein
MFGWGLNGTNQINIRLVFKSGQSLSREIIDSMRFCSYNAVENKAHVVLESPSPT